LEGVDRFNCNAISVARDFNGQLFCFMVDYNLQHLTQPANQRVAGPIQDDEALLLFGLIRVLRIRRILELGGLSGYSAINFLAAVGDRGVVYTVDIAPVPRRGANHHPIQRDAALIAAADVGSEALDLVFFDCHIYAAQITAFQTLRRQGVITERTLLVLHDTGLHPTQIVDWAYPIEDGWVHQPVERRMVNDFKRMGYDALVLDTAPENLGDMPYRQGLTIMHKFKVLET
jgi:predicted O-methyltransferase YrrM